MGGWLNKDEAAFIHFGLGPDAGWLRAKGVYDRESSSAFYDHWLARDTAIATGDYAASGPGAKKAARVSAWLGSARRTGYCFSAQWPALSAACAGRNGFH